MDIKIVYTSIEKFNITNILIIENKYGVILLKEQYIFKDEREGE